MTIAAPTAKSLTVDTETTVAALMEGAYLGNHVFDAYKSEKETTPLKRARVLVSANESNKLKHLAKKIETVCSGTLLARDWVSTPSNDKPPLRFAQAVSRLARKEKLKVTIKTEKKLADLGFGAMLAVAAGSKNTPRLLIVEYRPRNFTETISLVGKGVTFDSGGLNLKPAGSIEEMKMDMAGAAAVAATMITLARLKPKLRVIGAMPLVENMISGKATRPGDIIKTYTGKTVEIGNTDAEGRLILADTMAYIIKTYKPAIVLDMATLTGACMIALGEKIAGVFTRDDELADKIVSAGAEIHERCWRLPLPEDYKEMLKSDVADINNLASARWGGAITAALFLSEFVGDNRWAHIDIAGPAFAKKAGAYCGAGGTGFGVRLLCRLIEDIAGNK
jgi:leucyl aminopeptidase